MKTSPLARYPDWEKRLRTYLDSRKTMPFEWGVNDCATFIAGAVTAMTGVDVYDGFKGIYDTEEGSREALKTAGAGTLHRTVAKWLGKSKPAAQAKRGDVVMKDNFTLGICLGRWSMFVGQEAEEGLIHVPTLECRKAFSVPFTFKNGEMTERPSSTEEA